ncbi:MAG: hypothetical protein V4519_03785 [Patescibacteria group bacterium]
MSVEFDEPEDVTRFQSRTILGAPQTPQMVHWLTKKGIVKHQKHAYFMLLSISVSFFIAALVVLYVYVFPSRSNNSPIMIDPATSSVESIKVPDYRP